MRGGKGESGGGGGPFEEPGMFDARTGKARYRFQRVGFRVQGLGFGVQVSGFRM